MRTRSIIGVVLFVVGFAAFVGAFRAPDLMPREARETEAIDLLHNLHDHLERWLEQPAPADGAADAPRLEAGLHGAELFAAVGLPRTFADDWLHIPAQGVVLAEIDVARRTFRLEYDGRSFEDPGACRAYVTISRPGRLVDTRGRWRANSTWIMAGAALGGLLVGGLGLWMALSTILVRALVLDMIKASLAGVAGLTLILFLGASLQFIDRFSFLGPGFFFGAMPMLLAQVLPYTTSFGVLAGVTMVYGRMANDREENILQFNGIRLGVLVLPALIVGVLFTGVTFHASLYWAPAGAYAQDRLPYRVLAASLENLPSGSFAFGDSRLPFAMAYKRRTADGTLEGLSLLFLEPDDESGQMEPALLFCAARGRVVWSETLGQVRFELERCVSVNWRRWPEDQFPRSAYSTSLAVTRTVFATERSEARHRQLEGGSTLLPVHGGIQSVPRRAKTDTTWGLRERTERVDSWLQRVDRQRARHQLAVRERTGELADIRRDQETLLRQTLTAEQWQRLASVPGLPPASRPLMRPQLTQLMETAGLEPAVRQLAVRTLDPLITRAEQVTAREVPPDPGEVNPSQRAETELFKRIAVALSPLLFTLIALPLGLLIRQGNLLVAFMVAVLLVGVTWFLVLTSMEKLGREADAPARVVLIWPTVSVLATGAILSLLAFGGAGWRRSRRPGGDEDDEQPSGGVRSVDVFRADQPGTGGPSASTATAVRPGPVPAVEDTQTDEVVPVAPRAPGSAPPTQDATRDMTRPHLRPATAVRRYVPPPRPKQRLSQVLPEPLVLVLRRIRHAVSGTTIERYILRGTIVSLLASLFTVVVLFIVADTMVNVDYFRHVAEARADAAYSEIALQYYIARVPQILYMVGPLVTLFALAFTLTRFVRSNEYLVLQATGVSTWRVLRPMLLVSAVVATLMLAYNQWGAPQIADYMREKGAYMERRATVTNRVVTDTEGRMFWIRDYRSDAHPRVIGALLAVSYDQQFPPRVVMAWPVSYNPSIGWKADNWREMTLVDRAFEGERIRTFDVVASSGPLPEPPPDSRAIGSSGAVTARGSPEDVDVYQPVMVDEPTDAIDTPMRPADINRRVTQILEDRSITDLWEMSRDQPDWNAPQVMFHRGFIYPLSNLILFLIGMPLVLRVAHRSAWHGVGLSVLLAVCFYAAMISLSGWGLFSTSLSPGVILWLGISPFVFAGIRLFLTDVTR